MAGPDKKDYYGALGVKKTATADEIRKAFRKLARKYHPDVNPGDKKAEERFKEISEANDVLSDEKKRKVFDQLGFYSDSIDPAQAEAAARGGYGQDVYTGGGRWRRAGQGVPFDFGGFDFSGFQGGQGDPRQARPSSRRRGGSFKDIFGSMFGGGGGGARQEAAARATAGQRPGVPGAGRLLDGGARRHDAGGDYAAGAVPDVQGQRHGGHAAHVPAVQRQRARCSR